VTTYSWSGAPAAPGSPSVTAKNNATGTSVATAFTVTADDTAPAVGTISYLNGSTSSTSLSVAFTTGTDAGSGVGTRLLQRAQAPLSGGVCGTFGGFSTIATNASSPYVDTVNGGTCYKYQYVVSDNLGNTGSPATSASVAMVTAPYATTVTGTAGILNYWRLGESTLSSDSFTGTAGTDLGSHTSDNGAGWTRWVVDTPTAVLTSGNRLTRNGVGGISYLTSVVPNTADYQVSADVYVASLITDDAAGVVGRFDTTNTNATRYMARYNVTKGWWELRKDVNGAGSSLGTWTATLTVGQTYNVALDMKGTTIRMLVDGVVRASVTDTSISGVGAAGIRLGSGNTGASPTDTTGLHLDNFRLNPPAADTVGTNRGDYLNTTTLGASGPFSGTADTAAQFDGVRNAVAVSRQVSTDFSVEFWFKSTQGIGTGANWYNAAALVDNTSASVNQNDWGIALRSDGKVVAGVGNPDTSIMSGTGYNDGAWHQVVFTRSSAGPIVLYVDGTQVASGTGTTAALTAVATITFGRQSATGTNAFAGYLDDVSVYSAVLSPSTVSGHFNASR
jgi:concanavalin A-like lectin/glucanase superfamily protein